MAEHSGIFDWVKKKNGDGPVSLRSFFSYFTSDGSVVPLSALPDDNSLVTRSMLNLAVGSIPVPGDPVTQLITAGTSPVTSTIPYTGFTFPQVYFRDSTGRNYTPPDWQDTGTSIILTSPDNGSGFSADTYTIIISGG